MKKMNLKRKKRRTKMDYLSSNKYYVLANGKIGSCVEENKDGSLTFKNIHKIEDTWFITQVNKSFMGVEETTEKIIAFANTFEEATKLAKQVEKDHKRNEKKKQRFLYIAALYTRYSVLISEKQVINIHGTPYYVKFLNIKEIKDYLKRNGGNDYEDIVKCDNLVVINNMVIDTWEETAYVLKNGSWQKLEKKL